VDVAAPDDAGGALVAGALDAGADAGGIVVAGSDLSLSPPQPAAKTATRQTELTIRRWPLIIAFPQTFMPLRNCISPGRANYTRQVLAW
jgi:hypothetical protein